MVAGVGRALDAIEQFRFGDEELGFLRREGVVDDATADWLADYRFSGDIWGYPEGETYFRLLAAGGGRGRLRRGGGAGDAAAEHLQPRRRDRLRRLPHDVGRG